ncbi:hypothetical protein Syun_022887 [Stephania yunnanensis]|uniref:Uncharacterized protein n=1 Tax=Stephania yunnanensis TaxID=152371 RepID=A0AAP0I323_9MAGN
MPRNGRIYASAVEMMKTLPFGFNSGEIFVGCVRLIIFFPNYNIQGKNPAKCSLKVKTRSRQITIRW